MDDRSRELIDVLTMSKEELQNKYLTLRHVNGMNIDATARLEKRLEKTKRALAVSLDALNWYAKFCVPYTERASNAQAKIEAIMGGEG